MLLLSIKYSLLFASATFTMGKFGFRGHFLFDWRTRSKFSWLITHFSRLYAMAARWINMCKFGPCAHSVWLRARLKCAKISCLIAHISDGGEQV
jgi:hypothetical protein